MYCNCDISPYIHAQVHYLFSVIKSIKPSYFSSRLISEVRCFIVFPCWCSCVFPKHSFTAGHICPIKKTHKQVLLQFHCHLFTWCRPPLVCCRWVDRLHSYLAASPYSTVQSAANWQFGARPLRRLSALPDLTRHVVAATRNQLRQSEAVQPCSE